MQKLTLAALAAIGVALSLAVVPALTNQVFAAKPECPGCEGGGHEEDFTNRGGHEKDEDSRAAKCEIVYAGQSGNPKGTIGDNCKKVTE